MPLPFLLQHRLGVRPSKSWRFLCTCLPRSVEAMCLVPALPSGAASRVWGLASIFAGSPSM